MSRRVTRAEAYRRARDGLATIRERSDELLRQSNHYDVSDEGQARRLLEYAEDLRQSASALVANLTVLARV